MKRRLFNILSTVSLLLCVAMVVLWVRSYWNFDSIDFTWNAPRTCFNRVSMDSRHGQVALDYIRVKNGEPNWLGYYCVNAYAKWGVDSYHRQAPNGREDYMAIWVPYWVLVLSSVVSPLLWLNSHVKKRRLKQGLCLTCGYDLRATPDRCPECGTPMAATVAKA